MKIDINYHCFACGAGGDVIDYVSRMFGLSQYGAARKLIDDFCLPICQYRNRGISIVCKCKEKFDFFGFGNRHHKAIGEKATGRNHFNIYRI